MTTQRRGLRVLNTFEPLEAKQAHPPDTKKRGVIGAKAPAIVQKLINDKSAVAKVAPFKVFWDPVENHCQHCGAARINSAQERNPVSVKDSKDAVTQIETDDLIAWLSSEDPPEDYWQVVAEQRRVA
ncbi:unnamed protein product [Heterobilharzia americana]|nr:unnamed protein product [Heterobilharzia americana]